MAESKKKVDAPAPVLPNFLAGPSSTKPAAELRFGDVVYQPHAVVAVSLTETDVQVSFDDGTSVTYQPTDAVQIGP